MTTKELIRAEIRKWQSNIEAKCPESTSSRNYTKEEWNAIYEYNAYTRLLSFLDTLPDEPSCPISDGWKPTEAQMNGLAHAINLDVYDAERYGLDSLYNDLKKLM